MYVLSVIWPPIGRQIEIIQWETRKDLHQPHLLHLALSKALTSGGRRSNIVFAEYNMPNLETFLLAVRRQILGFYFVTFV